jgi:glycosyltransferase involved in cell wall biosynthesis
MIANARVMSHAPTLIETTPTSGVQTRAPAGRPLRFCMVTTFYPPYNFGGDGIGVQRLCRALVRRGHHVTVIQDIDAFLLLNGGEPSAPADDDGVHVVRLKSRLGAASSLLTQQTGRPVVHGNAIRKLVARGNFDVINFHNISLVGGPGILAVGDGLKVMMAHEHWLVCPSHVLWRHDREPCTGRECTRCVLAYRRPPQAWRYTGYLERELRHIDLFIAMSEFSRAKHAEFGFAPPMEVLPYFLPDSVGQRVSSQTTPSPSPDRPYFLFVGRLEKIKGLDDVIAAFRRYPHADLIVAGNGTYEEALRAQAAGMSNVKFLGRLNPEQLTAYYEHALALLVPSVGFETFGIILIEAFRSSLPVIARRIGPFPEIVELARGGALFGTEAELLSALDRMQHDRAYRARLAQNGRDAFHLHWSESVVVPRYLELLRAAAERSGRTETARLLARRTAS